MEEKFKQLKIQAIKKGLSMSKGDLYKDALEYIQELEEQLISGMIINK